MKQHSMRALLCFSLALFIFFILSPIAGADDLYSSVIRIHVLASSDSEKDQELKLAVRDALIQFAGQEFSQCKTKEQAQAMVLNKKEAMETLATEILLQNGCDDSVEICLTEEYYPTREYEKLRLPEGRYLSLQVKIGQGQGKNWWCILFPPLCLDSAASAEDALMDAGMTEENVKTVTAGRKQYRIRFKIVEWWGSAKEQISQLF
jgi:stage II sporulation protein R